MLSVLCVLGVAARAATDALPGAAATPVGKALKPPIDDGFLGQMGLSSRKDPIVVNANQLEFDYQKDRVVYRGKVHVTQADLTIDSAILTVTYSRADDQKQTQLKEVVAEGDVVITQGLRWATGGKAIFDQGARTIVLLDSPVLHDGPNEVSGDRLTVFLDEGRSVVESGQQKRVSAILYPGKGSDILGGEKAANGGSP
jgi:lipopolysaccharide export system protein LptA